MTKTFGMYTEFGLCLAIGLAATMPAFSTISIPSDTQVIQTEIQSMANATNKGDANGSVAYISPTYVDYDATGHIDCRGKAQDLQNATNLMAMASNINIQATLQSIKFSLNKTLAVVQESDQGTLQVLKNGAPVTMAYYAVVKTVWIKQSSGVWLQDQANAVSSAMKPAGRLASGGPVS